MVEKLSVSIALLGGDEVQRQLAGIGMAGQKAFADISKAAEKVGGFQNLNPQVATDAIKKFGVTSVAELNKIQAAVSKAADFEKLVDGLQAAEAAFTRFGAAITAFGSRFQSVGFIVAAFAAGFVKGALGVSKSIEEIVGQAAKLGLTVNQFDQLRLGFEQAGISSKAVGDGLQQLQGVMEKLNLERVKKAFDDLQVIIQSSGRRFADGTTKLQFLREAAEGIGPVADAAREALQKLGTESPLKALNLGPVGQFLKDVGLSLDNFNASLLRLDPTKLIEIIGKLQEMADTAERSQLAIKLFGDQLGVELIQAFRTGSFAVDNFKSKIGALTDEQVRAAAEQQQALNKLLSAWERFKQQIVVPAGTRFLDAAREDLEQFGRDLQANIAPAQQWAERIRVILGGIGTGDIFRAMWEQAKTDANNFITWLGNLLTTPVAGAWQWLVTSLEGVLAQLQEKLSAFFASLREQASQGIASGAELGSLGGPGLAGGGLIGGRGSGTSDSNLAWVSRGEHIMPAHAVAQPGVLAFLEALRVSGGNLQRLLNQMGRFALGGLIMPRAIPAFAAGGLVGSNNVTIQFPGLPTITGLRASSDTVDELRKAAALAQVRSGGRKPSRYS
jgi:hypothetical protein